MAAVSREQIVHELEQDARRIMEKILVAFLSSPQEPLLQVYDKDPTEPAAAGVYALYIVNSVGTVYAGLPADRPIYIGKAESSGSRSGTPAKSARKKDVPLFKRLQQHAKSLYCVGLRPENFTCRWCSLQGELEYIIPGVEIKLIKTFEPLWNCIIDGFGNHNPGEGRLNQKRSKWDVLHAGRPWAVRLAEPEYDARQLAHVVQSYILRTQLSP